jgi:hypothetical protein
MHGFLYSNGHFATLNDPLAGANGSTFVFGINDSAEIVGYYQNSTGVHGFIGIVPHHGTNIF